MITILPNWHPIFVHYSVALLSVATVFHLLAVVLKPSLWRDEFTILARWTLWLGAGITLITVIFGFWAFNTVKHDDPSHVAMKIHRNWAMATFVVFLLLGVWSVWRHRIGHGIKPFFVALVLVGAGLLSYTAWRGGELVYRYGLGVMALPKADQHEHTADGHAHDHAEAEHHEVNPVTTMSPDPDAADSHPAEHADHDHAHLDAAPVALPEHGADRHAH